MASAQPAFGEMFRGLIELGVVEIDTEPLDACIERRLKEFWEHTFCPRCGLNAVQTWPSLDRVWCRDCNFKPVYTDGTPFHEKHLTCGEVLLASPSTRIHCSASIRSRRCSDGRTGQSAARFERLKPRFIAASLLSGSFLIRQSTARHKLTSQGRSVLLC
jgi:hypothetical protein